MFAKWQIKWQNLKARNMQSSRKTENTISRQSNTSRKDALFNISHYKTIYDCPKWNFEKAIELKDSRYLYILDNYSELKGKALDETLENIWWEYLEEKGIDSNFRLAYDLKIKIADLEFQQACGMNKKVQIEMAKTDLKGMFNHKKQPLSEQVAILSKFMGYQIDIKKVSVFDYVGIEKLYNKHVEATTKRR